MYISQLLPEDKQSKSSLLSSIIEPDSKNNVVAIQYMVKKIPLADRAQIKEYTVRTKQHHYNVTRLNITQTSSFYLNVQLQQVRAFDSRDLIRLPFFKRAKILADILKGVTFLAIYYGYFYLTEKMLGYGNDGQIVVWINQDYFANRPQYAINHGKLSEEIFVADFKDTFCGNFHEIKEFRKSRNIGNLLKILNRGEDIFHRNLMSEPISKESLIQRSEALKFSNLINNTSSKENEFHNRFQKKTLKHTESSHNIIININSQSLDEFNDKQKHQGKKLTRMLSSPCSIAQISQSSYGSMTSSNLPRINFMYMNKQAWKKKQTIEDNSNTKLLKSIRLNQTTTFNENTFRQTSKQFLKVSFPYTTTHSFSPIGSFGSINLNSREQIIQSSLNQIDLQSQSGLSPKGIEKIEEMEMQFQNLFQSNIMSEEQLQNLEVIMEEFQSILQA